MGLAIVMMNCSLGNAQERVVPVAGLILEIAGVLHDAASALRWVLVLSALREEGPMHSQRNRWRVRFHRYASRISCVREWTRRPSGGRVTRQRIGS